MAPIRLHNGLDVTDEVDHRQFPAKHADGCALSSVVIVTASGEEAQVDYVVRV
jgi:hypothetical protein